MEPRLVSEVFQVQGMSCASCELKIENALRKMAGVKTVEASLANSRVTVHYDSDMIKSEALIGAIQKLGYEASRPGEALAARKNSVNQLIGAGIIIFALYLIIRSTVGFNFIPQVDSSVGYGMLFVIGLLTSLHCIAMCGGINLSQCIASAPGRPAAAESKWVKFRPSLLYNAGRVLSYTLIGGMVGAIGSVVSFSGTAKGVVAIVGGLFMMVMGLNMLDIFPWLRRFKLSMPKFIGDRLYAGQNQRGPFIVGLLNGLMPCGPLQTMQLYALGTGSFGAGAAAMFLFSLGTVPLMFGFGALSSLLSRKFTHRMLKVSAVLVIVLGMTMLGRGLSLSGISWASVGPGSNSPGNVAVIEGDVQVVTTTFQSGRYQPFVVQKGIPVRWIIKVSAADLNGCNNPVTVPRYNIQKKLVPGDNIIEFTPQEEGSITYTCWMGMISSTIKVVPDLANVSASDLPDAAGDANQSQLGGGCCADSAKAVKFQGGRIPTDNVVVAQVKDGIQEATITVNDEGYDPAVIVLQRGIKAKLKFNPEKLNSCNNIVAFPEYGGQLDLSAGQLETPPLEVTEDFTFQCWMGMLHGYVKVVADLQQIDMKAIKKEVEAFRPAGGGGCCGG
ncbi:sulfite exporter TauE/SafE [Hydrogenispora ethanolica]|uniref:Sulfite exporter TauE/SafE n=1 Tax=Hydrogenispora ethanolica TaxID=1082276 RepID=A0A4V2QD15_HYDET|nr:sulfite exporter TauE/SafE family protein [Hydrogenispora ethanolica]TCL62067.1 sulfite exporter TauE/SafE [Hydrogenispora ethanolica]